MKIYLRGFFGSILVLLFMFTTVKAWDDINISTSYYYDGFSEQSLHSEGKSARYYAFILDKSTDIHVDIFVDYSIFCDVAYFENNNTEEYNNCVESLTPDVYIMSIDDNVTVLAHNPTPETLAKLSAGKYILEIVSTGSNLSMSAGTFSVNKYVVPTRWQRLSIMQSYYDFEPSGISFETPSIHREGSAASYYNLVLEEPQYISISAALFDVSTNGVESAESYIYIMQGEHENGKVLAENANGLYTSLPAGTYTIELTSEKPGYEGDGDINIHLAAPPSITTDMILQD